MTTLEHATAIKAFAEYTGCKIPQAVRAIDGTHIEILAPVKLKLTNTVESKNLQ